MAKKLTMDSLAAMTKRGFDEGRSDLDKFRQEVRGEFTNMGGAFKAIVDMLDLMRTDIRDIKITLGGLV